MPFSAGQILHPRALNQHPPHGRTPDVKVAAHPIDGIALAPGASGSRLDLRGQRTYASRLNSNSGRCFFYR